MKRANNGQLFPEARQSRVPNSAASRPMMYDLAAERWPEAYPRGVHEEKHWLYFQDGSRARVILTNPRGDILTWLYGAEKLRFYRFQARCWREAPGRQ